MVHHEERQESSTQAMNGNMQGKYVTDEIEFLLTLVRSRKSAARTPLRHAEARCSVTGASPVYRVGWKRDTLGLLKQTRTPIRLLLIGEHRRTRPPNS
jgi:hypothetical protein